MKNNLPLHILLIEDNPDHAMLVIRNLERFNVSCNLNHVDDGEKAMLYLKEIGKEKLKPDVILLDLRLPKIDGMEILRFIKENDFLNDIPVVVLTTSALEQKIIELNGNSPDGYLVKPIDFIKFSGLMSTFGLTQFNEIKR